MHRRPCEDDASVSPPLHPPETRRQRRLPVIVSPATKEEKMVCPLSTTRYGLDTGLEEKVVPIHRPKGHIASLGDKKPSLTKPPRDRRRSMSNGLIQAVATPAAAASEYRPTHGDHEFSSTRLDSIDHADLLIVYTIDFQGDHFSRKRKATDEGAEIKHPILLREEPPPHDLPPTTSSDTSESLNSQQSLSVTDKRRSTQSFVELSNLCTIAGCLEPNAEYCTAEEYMSHDDSWNNVREWIRLHSQHETTVPYLIQSNGYGQTALHLACLNQPPHDVIDHFISILREADRLDTLQHRDDDGRTPLHLLCANAGPTCQDTCVELAKYSESTLRERDNYIA